MLPQALATEEPACEAEVPGVCRPLASLAPGDLGELGGRWPSVMELGRLCAQEPRCEGRGPFQSSQSREGPCVDARGPWGPRGW